MRFDEFLKERDYLLGVSKKTLIYYRCAFNSWEKHATDGKVLTWIQGMKAAGISNISINTYICAMRAYFRWAEPERPRIAYLKEEQKILATLPVKDIGTILGFNPTRVPNNLRRAHLVALTILDTGLRISEVLGLAKENVDFDNLVIRVIGKGGKHRLIPFSVELRKSLWRYSTAANHSLGSNFPRYLFATRNNTNLSTRNLGRDLRILGKTLGIAGIRFSARTFRHTFSVQYLKNGGNLEYLRRILGHSSISTTQKYLRSLGVEDLGAVHNSLSPLSARR